MGSYSTNEVQSARQMVSPARAQRPNHHHHSPNARRRRRARARIRRPPGAIRSRPRQHPGARTSSNMISRRSNTPRWWKLTATLSAPSCTQNQCRYPADADGKLIPHKLPDDELEEVPRASLGHYHIQDEQGGPRPGIRLGLRHRQRAKINDREVTRSRFVPPGI